MRSLALPQSHKSEGAHGIKGSHGSKGGGGQRAGSAVETLPGGQESMTAGQRCADAEATAGIHLKQVASR